MQLDVDVLWIARYDYEPEWHVLSHAHDFYQLIFALDGRGTVSVQGTAIDIVKDQLLILPPGVPHEIFADQGEPLRTLDTKFAVIDKSLDEAIRKLPSIVNDPHHRVLYLLEKLRIEGMKRRGWYREMCNAVLTQGLIVLLHEHESEQIDAISLDGLDNEEPTIAKAKKYIDKHLSDDISVRDIASHVGYTPEYLSRHFRQKTGVSPHAYLMQLRIRKAKEMLKYDESSIKEVTSRTGFKTIHHFSRLFKKMEGIPPAAWRDRELSGVWKNVVIAPGFVNTDRTVDEQGIAAFESNDSNDTTEK